MSAAENADDGATQAEVQGEAGQRVPGGELGFAAALFVVAAGVGALAFGIDGREAVWPQILSVLFIALTGGDLVVTFRKWRVPADPTAESDEPAEADSAWQRVLMCCWLVAFALVGTRFGFGWATVVLVPVFQLMKGRRNPVPIAATTAGLAVAFHLLFEVLAGVPIWMSP